MSDLPQSTPLEISQIQARLNQWQSSNPNSTLNEIQEAVEEELNKLRKQLTESMVEQIEADETQSCPSCDGPLMRNGKKKRVLRDKGGESIEFTREQMRCHQCGTTIFPPR